MKTCKFIVGALLMMSATAMADEFNYLTIGYSDTEESISLPTISKITFSEGNCVVATTEGEFKFPLSEMKKMTFTANATAIEALPEEAPGIAFQEGTLKVTGDGMLRIYNANGMLTQMAKVKEGANVNLSNLPSGLYIVDMNGKVIKIRK